MHVGAVGSILKEVDEGYRVREVDGRGWRGTGRWGMEDEGSEGWRNQGYGIREAEGRVAVSIGPDVKHKGRGECAMNKTYL